jgi:uncharacterized protein (TIGR02996 family)
MARASKRKRKAPQERDGARTMPAVMSIAERVTFQGSPMSVDPTGLAALASEVMPPLAEGRVEGIVDGDPASWPLTDTTPPIGTGTLTLTVHGVPFARVDTAQRTVAWTGTVPALEAKFEALLALSTLTEQERAFVRQAGEKPADRSWLLVYADWLEEQAREQEAAAIRAAEATCNVFSRPTGFTLTPTNPMAVDVQYTPETLEPGD